VDIHRLKMKAEEIKKRIIRVLQRDLGLKVSADEIRDACRLSDLFGMDSVAVVEFIIGIEKEFSVRVPVDRLTRETFHNLKTTADCIKELLRQAP